MTIVERSAIIPLDLDAAWEAFFGDELQNWVRLSDSVVEVRDFTMRPDGTPEYVMVNQAGPRTMSHRSDYTEWSPPRRAQDRTLDSALGGTFTTTHEPVDGGTLVTHRWDVEPHGIMKVLFPLMRRGMQKGFQQDLDDMAARLGATTSG